MAMQVKVKQSPNLKKLQKLFLNSPAKARLANKRIAKEAAIHSRDYARTSLMLQTFPGANIPLDEEYAARKLAEGYGDKILIRTETYLDNIKAHKIDDVTYAIGVKQGTVINGVDYYLIALFQEFGTKGIPPRPLWSNVDREMKKAFPEIFRRHYERIFPELLK